ncbi:MAG: hypothetical protein LBM98_12035 [Oscillospiraceae bacterium]|nr:hypothetical protein [Oscillospiraceae bacterium]
MKPAPTAIRARQASPLHWVARPPQTPSNPIPLLGGVPPAGGGVVSPAGRNPRPNLSSLIFDIC